jgi:quercetin dioxygenase-like cupin family protein
MAKKVKSRTTAGRKAKSARSHSRAQRAVTKHAASKTELQYIPWNTIPLEDLKPLLQRQFVVGQEIMLARVLLKKGCVVPEHSHHTGEVLCIPAHMPHRAEALEDTVDLDVFNPPRADWINKTDQYLRSKK